MPDPTPDVKATTTIAAPGAPPAETTSTTTLKSGWKTTELWFAKVIAVIGALMASGYIADGTQTARICGAIMVGAAALGYPISRGLAKSGAAMVLILAVLSSSSACGGSTKETRLRTAMTGLTTASSAFVAYDQEHQAQIVEHATSLTEGKSQLEAYRAKRGEVVERFAAAYHAIAAAAVLDSSDTNITNALLAAQLALKSWDALKGGGAP